jgi:hypothetical protein
VERYFQIVKINLKYNLLPHLLLSVVFLCISPLLMGTENLDAVSTAKVLELYAAFVGIILLTPVFLPEQNNDTRDLVEAKYTPAAAVSLIRILEACFSMSVLLGAFVLYLQNNNCSFPELKFYVGTLAEAFFLGGMGLCAYSIFDQIAVAYLIPLMYYIMAFAGGKKLLGHFYLFSMTYGSYQEKRNLAVLGFVLIVIGITYRYKAKLIVSKMIRH